MTQSNMFAPTIISRCLALAGSAAIWFAASSAPAADPAPAPAQAPLYKAAIIVENRAGTKLEKKVLSFCDEVSSLAAGKHFSIIKSEDIVKTPTNSTNLRIAQAVGADFVLFVSLSDFAREVKRFSNPNLGIKTESTVYVLRGSYRVAEGVTGGALGGDTFVCNKTIMQTSTLQTEDEDVLNGLLTEAAGKVADGLAAKAAQFRPPATLSKVEISVACGVKDLAGNEVSIPDLRVTEDNRIAKAGEDLPAQASATIKVDGFATGTTPAKIKVASGPHSLVLSRPGFADVELTINAEEGLQLTPTMQMTEEGFARWKEIRTFLNALDRSRKLTDAQVKVIEGYAQMLRQSGFRVDAKSDIKVDTKEGMKFNLYKSLY